MRRAAAIDLGTNTFHLLIVEKDKKGFKEIFRERKWVSLAEDGIAFFSDRVLERALHAIASFVIKLDEYNVELVKTTGTEAFRSASNGGAFLADILQKYKLRVDVISGMREAELIYKGASLLVSGDKFPNIIMDIGGGSTEFILYNHQGMLWSHSYKAGVTHLFNLFVTTDPISKKEVAALRMHLRELFKNFPLHLLTPDSVLVGASGSFEVLESMLGRKNVDDNNLSGFSLADFYEAYDEIEFSTLQDRLDHPGIPNDRAQLIVVAFTLIDEVIKLLKPSRIIVSPYALKEGVVREILEI